MNNLNYKVVKREKSIQILMDTPQARQEEFKIFLNSFSRSGIGEESLREFLDNNNGFIPLKEVKTGTLSLINLKQVIYLLDMEPLSAVTRKKVHLTMTGGIEMDVTHFKNLPDNQSRILDYLNAADPFVSFLKDGSLVFINKSKIMRSEEYE